MCVEVFSVHCVSGRVVDENGVPWTDADVSVVRELPGEGRETVALTTNGSGTYSTAVHPGSLALIQAERSSAGRNVRAKTSVEVPPGAAASCGGNCATAADPTGSPLAGAEVTAFFFDVSAQYWTGRDSRR